ncbi:SGNH/GDSL hydrolase family protein [Paenibacillus apiarius]|uniref:SGNH/GDSL hydrolase family protein n=1 Tax=Paenibacillus apiarius TaxID=46240 RepID=UPI001981F43C|nr:SGNH/GDSL hydrolase family protein [Paenibacillus apiarius]MBN3523353.1 SGNH/GDSL hydrolase family protein [Paenibacillus apiarius]
MTLQQRDKVVIIGDSITDCERARPVGEGLFGALGKGYVSLFDALLQTEHPELGTRVVNMGVSGNTVVDVEARWDTDVLQQQPDGVILCIGINDVWRQFDMPHVVESHVYADDYEAVLERLVACTKSQVRWMVLMTPFYIEPNPQDEMRRMMDEYGRIVKRTAEKHGTLFVDTQAVFDRLLLHMYPASLAWDRVHPNAIGHMAIAKALIHALPVSSYS